MIREENLLCVEERTRYVSRKKTRYDSRRNDRKTFPYLIPVHDGEKKFQSIDRYGWKKSD